MTDWSGALARAFQQHLEIRGSGGSVGSRRAIERPSKDNRENNSGTSLLSSVVLEVPEEHSPPVDAIRRTTATTMHSEVVPSDPRQGDTHERWFAGLETSGTTGTTERDHGHEMRDRFEARAAIVEDGAGVPRSWAESYARLDIGAQRWLSSSLIVLSKNRRGCGCPHRRRMSSAGWKKLWAGLHGLSRWTQRSSGCEQAASVGKQSAGVLVLLVGASKSAGINELEAFVGYDYVRAAPAPLRWALASREDEGEIVQSKPGDGYGESFRYLRHARVRACVGYLRKDPAHPSPPSKMEKQ
jgi:hypothetical protein